MRELEEIKTEKDQKSSELVDLIAELLSSGELTEDLKTRFIQTTTDLCYNERDFYDFREKVPQLAEEKADEVIEVMRKIAKEVEEKEREKQTQKEIKQYYKRPFHIQINIRSNKKAK